MKKYFFALVMFFSFGMFANMASAAPSCTAGTCNDAGILQQQQQQQGTNIDTNNSNYATNSPTAVMSAVNNVYTGQMNYSMDGVSCPSTQLYVGAGAGHTQFNPSGANSQNYQVNGGIAIPLDSDTCNQVMEFKKTMFERMDTEATMRMCFALKNDGLQDLAFDPDFNRDFPGTVRCQSIFNWMKRSPEAFSNPPQAMLEARVKNIESTLGKQFKK